MATVTFNPSQSADDAWQNLAGDMTLTAEIRLTAGTAWAGLILDGIPTTVNGANIISATLYYQATVTSHDDPYIDWYLQDADTAALFTTTTSDISSRPRTTAVTTDQATSIGTGYRAVDLTAQVIEVLSRPGFGTGGRVIAVIGDAQTGCDLWLRTWDSGGDVWYVEVVYSAGSLVLPRRRKTYLRM